MKVTREEALILLGMNQELYDVAEVWKREAEQANNTIEKLRKEIASPDFIDLSNRAAQDLLDHTLEAVHISLEILKHVTHNLKTLTKDMEMIP